MATTNSDTTQPASLFHCEPGHRHSHSLFGVGLAPRAVPTTEYTCAPTVTSGSRPSPDLNMMLKRMIPWTALVVAILVSAGYIGQRQSASALDIRTARSLEQQLESLRQRLRTPSFAAGVVRDGELVWAKGFGYADIENQIEPTEHTPYHLASLTKTFASTILLQLVEQGLIDLDTPIADYGLEIPSEGVIMVRHLFSHTSQDPPGRYYRYNGARFGRLDWIIRAATSESFGDLLEERIVHRTGLDDTSPSTYAENYDSVLVRLAKPYQVDDEGEFTLGEYPTYFGTSAGLVSSVADLAKYSTGIANHIFVSEETQALAFAPSRSTTGEELPYGLGWFTQDYMGVRLIWHYGYWTCNSSLIITAPDEQLTFIILTNTDALSRGFSLGAGDVLASPAALVFLRALVLEDKYSQPIPDIDWQASARSIAAQFDRVQDDDLKDLLKKELMSEWLIASVANDSETEERLFEAYSQLFAQAGIGEISGLRQIARIEQVGNREDRTEEFALDEESVLRVYASGEVLPWERYDYGWIEDAESGDTVWEMTEANSEHAGGIASNRRTDETVTLPAGRYRLRYVSDGGHAFGSWAGFPPDDRFWGIAVFEASSM